MCPWQNYYIEQRHSKVLLVMELAPNLPTHLHSANFAPIYSFTFRVEAVTGQVVRALDLKSSEPRFKSRSDR